MANGAIISSETEGFYLHFPIAFHIVPKTQVGPETSTPVVYCKKQLLSENLQWVKVTFHLSSRVMHVSQIEGMHLS